MGPRASRPHVPDYGIPEDEARLLSWSWARERLERAIVYWLATVGQDAAPHAIPIWGAWVDDRWYVEGGPRVRWQRNLKGNPRASVHLEVGDEVVIVEGVARELVAPAEPLSSRILAGYAKYRAKDYEATADNWREGGLWELTPSRAFAWSTFPDDMTRFTFDE
jgi:nitroimidazol reductase NimA-like FMN-containing flavoprotein (pyridoxamine 5'-phosphate oxidase superfamily)